IREIEIFRSSLILGLVKAMFFRTRKEGPWMPQDQRSVSNLRKRDFQITVDPGACGGPSLQDQKESP
ncbi:MAG: hypothetical protein ONB13_06850, partial [candidate division KSB1 bacterium]|nr:hypothetical protein [candidate division KSB1 bacterium]